MYVFIIVVIKHFPDKFLARFGVDISLAKISQNVIRHLPRLICNVKSLGK